MQPNCTKKHTSNVHSRPSRAALIATSVVGVHWDCAQNADCADVPQAFCAIALGECRCPAGHTFAGNVTVCVPESLNGEPCDEDGQCAHMLTGAHCSANGVCECVDGYTYIRGRCRQLQPLHGRCNEVRGRLGELTGNSQCLDLIDFVRTGGRLLLRIRSRIGCVRGGHMPMHSGILSADRKYMPTQVYE